MNQECPLSAPPGPLDPSAVSCLSGLAQAPVVVGPAGLREPRPPRVEARERTGDRVRPPRGA